MFNKYLKEENKRLLEELIEKDKEIEGYKAIINMYKNEISSLKHKIEYPNDKIYMDKSERYDKYNCVYLIYENKKIPIFEQVNSKSMMIRFIDGSTFETKIHEEENKLFIKIIFNELIEYYIVVVLDCSQPCVYETDKNWYFHNDCSIQF